MNQTHVTLDGILDLWLKVVHRTISQLTENLPTPQSTSLSIWEKTFDIQFWLSLRLNLCNMKVEAHLSERHSNIEIKLNMNTPSQTCINGYHHYMLFRGYHWRLSSEVTSLSFFDTRLTWPEKLRWKAQTSLLHMSVMPSSKLVSMKHHNAYLWDSQSNADGKSQGLSAECLEIQIFRTCLSIWFAWIW